MLNYMEKGHLMTFMIDVLPGLSSGWKRVIFGLGLNWGWVKKQPRVIISAKQTWVYK